MGSATLTRDTNTAGSGDGAQGADAGILLSDLADNLRVHGKAKAAKGFKLGIPRANFVVVDRVKLEANKAGIIIPDQAQKRGSYGTVMAVGPEVPVDIRVGDRVLWGVFTGIEVMLDADHSKQFEMMSADCIYMILGRE